MTEHEKYMERCMALAKLGKGTVAPNPMVGAVLVYDGKILGEGYHQQYGEAHAEVNCINSVASTSLAFIPQSTLYVSLKPCAHFGKTPPCADLIIRSKIPRVVIGCRDPFKEVNGRGIEKLQDAGIEVIEGILEKECIHLNRRFFTFHTKHRPYIILKWAQSANGMIGTTGHSRVQISNDASNLLVHKWRSEEAGIMVGTNTALHDNPSLTNRLWSGNNPVRVVLDMHLRLPLNLYLFDGTVKTIVVNTVKQEEKNNVLYVKIKQEEELVPQLMQVLYQLNIQSVLVEGGTRLLQSFINSGIFDELRIITNNQLQLDNGLPAPSWKNGILEKQQQFQYDSINFYSYKTTL